MQDEPNFAIESFNRVPKEILKEYAEAQIFLALTYRDQHEYDLAVEAFNRVPTEIKQEYAKAQYFLALMYSQQDKINLAIYRLCTISDGAFRKNLYRP
jgi:tetratricopeptide (TPR) repeat protein